MGVQWMHACHFFLYMKRNYLIRETKLFDT